MKKVLTGFGLFIMISLVFSSCKTHEKCPAFGKYGKIERSVPPVQG